MSTKKEIKGWSIGTSEGVPVSPACAERRSGTCTTSIEVTAEGHVEVEHEERHYDGSSYTCTEIPLEVLRAVLDAVGFDLVKSEP